MGMIPHCIIIAGMPRSGTTWAFNIVRLALTMHVGDRLNPGTVEPTLHAHWREYNPEAQYNLVKVHAFDPDPANIERLNKYATPVVVTSERNLLDIAASAIRMGWVTDMPFIDRCVENLRQWRAHPGHVFHFTYESFASCAHPGYLAQAMLTALDIPIELPEIMRICKEVDGYEDYTGIMQHHPVTLMNRQHRASGGRINNRDGLPLQLAKEIRNKYYPEDRHEQTQATAQSAAQS